MRNLTLVLIAVLGTASQLQAQRRGTFEIGAFPTIAYYDKTLKLNQATVGPGVRLGYFLTDNIAIEGDVSAHYRGGDVLVYALGGPRFTYRGGRVEPYAHVLAGGAFVGSTGRFAMAMGGGIDYKVSDRFALRLVQVDYTPIFAEGATLNDFRISTGVAWRF